MAFRLVMDVPTRDVFRLLMGRLKAETGNEKKWLARERRHIERAVDSTSHLEAVLPTRDPTPDAVRVVAYRVEARRALLQKIDDLAIGILLVAAIVGVVTALAFDVIPAIALALVGSGAAAWLRRAGHKRAREVFAWRQGQEPVAWALYYPAQLANGVVAADEELHAARDETPAKRWEALEGVVQRGPDESVLPGQDDKVAAIANMLTVQLPRLIWATDASRLIAMTLSTNAAAAAELVRGEYAHQVGTKERSSLRASGSVPVTMATRAYGFLMNASVRFAELPRPELAAEDMDVSFREWAERPTFRKLLEECRRLLVAAEQIARGEWPAEGADGRARQAERGPSRERRWEWQRSASAYS